MGSLQPTTADSNLFSYSYLTAVNLITCGIELCSSAAFGYLPPLLLEAGFSESSMSMVMATGPLVALFLLPVMGTASDQCKSRYGRRRPFIFILSIGILVALILLPNGTAVAQHFKAYVPERTMGLAILAFAVILLDFCTQVCFTPIESLLSDPCQTEFHRNRTFSIFSLMMSVGACLGYFVMSVDWNQTMFGQFFGGQENTLFTILITVFCTSFLISFYVAYDPPLEVATIANKDKDKPKSPIHSHKHNGTISTPLQHGGTILSIPMVSNVPGTVVKPRLNPFHCLTKVLRFPMQLKFSSFCCLSLPKILYHPIADTIRGVRTMPKVLRTLWLAHLLTSTAVMGFRLFFTDYIGESLFHGNPDSPEGSVSRIAYEDGVRTGSMGLLLHSILSALFSVVISWVMGAFGAVNTYVFGMVSFTTVTFLMLFVDGITFTLLLAAFTGFANAVVTTVPYTLLTSYHQRKEIYYPSFESEDTNIHGKGADMALLDSAYILSEVISSFVFGMIVEFTKTTGSYITCSFVCGLISCVLVLQMK